VRAGGTGLPLHHGCGKAGAAEEDAVSEVSEAGLRELLGEQGAGAEEPGAGGTPLVLPMASARRAWRFHLFSFTFSVPLSFPWCASLLLGTDLGGGQREACDAPPLRGQRTGNGLYIISPSSR